MKDARRIGWFNNGVFDGKEDPGVFRKSVDGDLGGEQDFGLGHLPVPCGNVDGVGEEAVDIEGISVLIPGKGNHEGFCLATLFDTKGDVPGSSAEATGFLAVCFNIGIEGFDESTGVRTDDGIDEIALIGGDGANAEEDAVDLDMILDGKEVVLVFDDIRERIGICF